MNFEALAWKDGIAALMGAVLLKILYDAVYRKIPLGFRRLRSLLNTQNQILVSFKDDQGKALQTLQQLLSEVHRTTVRGHKKKGIAPPEAKPGTPAKRPKK